MGDRSSDCKVEHFFGSYAAIYMEEVGSQLKKSQMAHLDIVRYTLKPCVLI